MTPEASVQQEAGLGSPAEKLTVKEERQRTELQQTGSAEGLGDKDQSDRTGQDRTGEMGRGQSNKHGAHCKSSEKSSEGAEEERCVVYGWMRVGDRAEAGRLAKPRGSARARDVDSWARSMTDMREGTQ